MKVIYIQNLSSANAQRTCVCTVTLNQLGITYDLINRLLSAVPLAKAFCEHYRRVTYLSQFCTIVNSEQSHVTFAVGRRCVSVRCGKSTAPVSAHVSVRQLAGIVVHINIFGVRGHLAMLELSRCETSKLKVDELEKITYLAYYITSFLKGQ